MGDMVDDIANAGADGDGDGAWASDDIPVSDAPTGTSAPTRPVDPTAVSSSATTIGAPVFGAFTTASSPSITPPTTPFWTRGKQAAVGAVAAGVLVVAAVSLTGGTDDASDSASSGTEVVVPDESVDPEMAVPDTTDPESTDAPARPSTTAPEPFTQERISLPPVLARMSVPTEVLLLSDDGVLHTVSLPSGLVRSVPLGSTDANGGFGGQDIAVAPDAAAVPLGDGLAIVTRTSPVATIVDGSELPAEGFGVFGVPTSTMPAACMRSGRTVPLDASMTANSVGQVPRTCSCEPALPIWSAEMWWSASRPRTDATSRQG